ncbi:MAG: hypothetical protein Q8L36_03915 [bacterium]|nr:hypothetical protein [bacterium]
MTTAKIIKHSIINSVGAAAYVTVVAQIIRNGEAIFGQMKSAFAPVAFLLLFSVSAAVMAILVFGQPIIWYVEGFKKQGIRLAIYTVALLFLITFLTILFLI